MAGLDPATLSFSMPRGSNSAGFLFARLGCYSPRMPDTDALPKTTFSSTVFPTPEDKALWEKLTPAEKRALVERDEEEGFQSGVGPQSSMQEILAEVLAEAQK